ncbi:MAG: SUMF1/EgtB/PvdO family nonheme iron enzyme [Phycisphaerales bacterium]|nr:SUMF1/EgtB/PvdO family nonheme iron enzyme [Phycisphaerales bacterium]
MSPIRVIVVSLFVAFGTSTPTHAECPIQIPTVLIGNPGNALDPTTGFGSVACAYNIGTTEVTNAQYAAFLNAKAASDPFNLYTTSMAGGFGGITRSGSAGSYTYGTVSGRANNPVNWVSFWDACRFANWLHNGQGSGDTETGAYTLTPGGIGANTITRNAGWQWAVTSEDEWYKAAYHQPASAGGDTDNYWAYPTQSNAVPTPAQANYNNVIGNTTTVGSYAANYYGTFDMGGNVWEWNEAVIEGSRRVLRGGSFGDIDSRLRADFRFNSYPWNEFNVIGFRVSRASPPPCIGDLNGDNAVSTADLTHFLGQFGSTVPMGTGGDFNCDGSVNTADLTIFLGRFGGAC